MKKKFEYKVSDERSMTGDMAINGMPANELQMAGEEGWELVAVLPVGSRPGLDGPVVRFYYKREVPA